MADSPVQDLCVVAAVIRRGDAVFLAQRPRGGRHAGKWEFPGGKVEPGEEPEAALQRELREELGLEEVVIGRHLGQTDHRDGERRILLHFYEVEADIAAARPTEHAATAWVAVGDLDRIPLAPGDVPFVARLQPPEP